MDYGELICLDVFQKAREAEDAAMERRLAGRRIETYLPLTDARAVAALFGHPQPLYFCRDTVELRDDPEALRLLEEGDPSMAYYGPMRDAAISLLQKRQYSLEERLLLLNDFGEICGKLAFEGRWPDLEEAIRDYEVTLPAHRLMELRVPGSSEEATEIRLDLFLDLLEWLPEDAASVWASLLEGMITEEEAVLMEKLAAARKAREAWEEPAFMKHLAVCLLFQSGTPFAFSDRIDQDMGWFVRYFALLDLLLTAAFIGDEGAQRVPAVVAAFCREMFFCEATPEILWRIPVRDYLSFDR